MKIALIGSGNVATVLGEKIIAARHQVIQVYSYSNLLQAQTLAAALQAEVITRFSQISFEADIYLLAVSDSALPKVAQALPKLTGTVLHTAGSVSISVLQNTSGSYGVLYPLQSLRKEKQVYDDIPLLIDGNTPETFLPIKNFAESISSRVQQADDAYRLRLHTAAVIVSNFTNHLYSLAASYCQKENVDFNLLHPLISETADRLQHYAPAEMQTGPAVRNDVTTIAKHLELLQQYPHLQKLYEVLTKSIQQTNGQ